MSDLRPAELAGRWYPGSAEACDQFFASVAPSKTAGALPDNPIGAIVPHAGWVYSGAIAYRALAAVAEREREPELVIVFGGHLSARDKPRVLIEGGWETPLGALSVAAGLAEDVSMAIESEVETPSDYFDDNAIEVLMPIVKKLWPNAQVITVGVPPTPEAGRIGGEVLDLAQRRGFKRIVVVGSTDLTHYGPNYNYQPQGRGQRGLEWVKTKNDPEIIERMEALDSGKVVWHAQRSRNACCAGAAAAAIGAARKLGATRGATLEYATSFDVRPNGEEPSSFVGYVGIVLG
jgi:MEMO1 family protein